MNQDSIVVNTALNEFVEMMWNARFMAQKKLSTQSMEAYRKAAQFASCNGLEVEARIADAAVYELAGQWQEAILCLAQCLTSPNNKLMGMAHFFMGSVYSEVNQVEKAIEHYDAAIADQRFDKAAWAHNNLGNMYFRKAKDATAENNQEMCEAWTAKVDAHYKASLEFEVEARYTTLYNLGRVALSRRDFAAALKYFNKSIKTNVPAEGQDYNELMKGAAYREKGTTYVLPLLENKGNAAKHLPKAIKWWEAAIIEFNNSDRQSSTSGGVSGKAAVALAKIRLANQWLESKRTPREEMHKEGNRTEKNDDYFLLRWWPPEEAGVDGYSTPEERIFSRIEAIGQDRYDLYKLKANSRFAARKKDPNLPDSASNCDEPGQNVLAILRGWGSATPLIEDASSACVGGGYFLKWRDKGLVIDPGMDFMRNFRACGFHMREVDGVIVSHDHTDHNADLIAIDDVFYEMHRRSPQKEGEAGQREGKEDEPKWIYHLIGDDRTRDKEFLKGDSGHRRPWRFYSQVEDQEKGEMSINLSLKNPPLPFKIHYFKAEHGGPHFPAFGLRIECLPQNEGEKSIFIGFTCDTEYFVGLEEHFKNCDILIAHISQPTLAELLSRSNHKKNHLGYRGVAELVTKCKPKLTILGEFWAGFADMRIDIAKGLQRIYDESYAESRTESRILPSGVGLFVNPENLEIDCSGCHKWRPASNISVSATDTDFGPLKYLCPFCRM